MTNQDRQNVSDRIKDIEFNYLNGLLTKEERDAKVSSLYNLMKG